MNELKKRTMNETPTEPKQKEIYTPSNEQRKADEDIFNKWLTSGTDKTKIPSLRYTWNAACAYARRTPLPTPPPEAAGETARTYDADRAEAAANLWNQLVEFAGEDADAQLLIESALLDYSKKLDAEVTEASECIVARDNDVSALTSKLAELTRELAESRIGPVAMKLAESQAEAHELSHKLTAKTLEAENLNLR